MVILEKPQLSPKLDVVFHMLFGEPKNENITKRLVEDVIGEKVEQIDLDKNPYLWGEQPNDKLGIIDIKAKINNQNLIDIEMQMSDSEELLKRILFYWAKMYIKQIERGEGYENLNRCISIIFTDFEIERLAELPPHTKWQIKESKYGKVVLTEELEINIISLTKINELSKNDALTKWLTFLNDPYGREVKEMAEKEDVIKEAVEKLDEINADEKKARIAELRQKRIWDERDALRTAEHKGIKQR